MDLTEYRSKWQAGIREIRNRLFKREVAVFLFFLLLAFVFWFLNALSKEMTGKIDYPARYINFPDERALVSDLPDYFELVVDGPGYSIVQTKLGGRKEHLTIDLDKASIKVQEDGQKLHFFVLSYTLRDEFESQLKSDFSIISISPDTIRFEFDKVSTKRVPVIPKIEVTTQRQYFVYGDVVCTPDSINITGPSTLVDTIGAVFTKEYLFEQLKETETRTVVLQPLSRISFSDRKCNITVPVEQFTEAVIELNVSRLNVPDSADVRLFPDKVTLQCIVALRDYNSISDAPIGAYVDLHDINLKSTNRLKVSLKDLPAYATQVKVSPQFVEFLIEKR